MGRSEARLFVTIWEDEDFIALPELSQRDFLFLLSQQELAHSGVVPLRERRWARKGPTRDAAELEDSLRLLAERRFIVVDWDTEELLIRSLMRRDAVFRQPSLVRSAIRSVATTESKVILREIAVEVARIRRDNPDLTRSQDAALTDLESVLVKRGAVEDSASSERTKAHPTEKGSAQGSSFPPPETSAKGLGGRGSVTAVTTDSPFPSSPEPLPPSAGASPPRAELVVVDDPGPEPRTTQEIVGWWIDGCTQRPAKSVVGQMSKHVKQLLEDGIQPVHIRRGIAEWSAKELHPSVLPSIVTHIANRHAPIRAAPPKQTRTETKLAANQQIAAQLRALEGRRP